MDLKSYCHNMSEAFMSANTAAISESINLIVNCIEEKRTILIAGNGGSASSASHFATDLGVGTFKLFGVAPRVISLSDSISNISATANDLSFDSVFSEQIAILGKSEDLLICISASGNSLNLVKAHSKAVEIEMNTLVITGFDGGILSKLTGVSVHFKTKIGEYGLAENCHSAFCHFITDEVRNILSNKK